MEQTNLTPPEEGASPGAIPQATDPGPGPRTLLKNYVRAGYPLLSVSTLEPSRFILAAVTEQRAETPGKQRVIFQWDAIRGFNQIGENTYSECSPFELPDTAAKFPGTIWIIKNYHFWLSEPQVIQSLQNNYPIYKGNDQTPGITLVFLSPSLTPPPELAREIFPIRFALPGRDDIGKVVDGTAAGRVELSPEDRERVIDSCQGLTWEEVEAALAYGLVSDRGKLNPGTIRELKAKMVEQSAGLTFSRFTETLEGLAGHENIKAWALNRFNRRALAKKYKLPFKGMLILGAPGCGKSHYAKALGNAVGWPVVILDVGRVFGGLVGQSEAQMDQVTQTLDALAPCIVIIEEIEKALAGVGAGTSSDGGTTQRVGAKFLTWLQDHESDCFCVATCNDIKSLAAASDGAFIRAGRWDGTFFVDLPQRGERKAILDLYLNQFTGKPLTDYPETPDLAGYSGAEIRQVAIETGYNGGDLRAAVSFVIPLSKTNKEKIDDLRKWAEGRTIPASIPEPGAEPGAGAGTLLNLGDYARAVSWDK